MSARYVVRLGKVRGRGRYACPCAVDPCLLDASHHCEVEPCSKTAAAKLARRRGGRVVRLLSPAEQADRAGARALRLHAARCRAEAIVWGAMRSQSDENEAEAKGIARGYVKAAEDAEGAASKLWPAKVRP